MIFIKNYCLPILCFLGLFLSGCKIDNSSQENVNHQTTQISDTALVILNKAADLMDSAKYAIASDIIRKSLNEKALHLSNTDKYYLYSFEAEILYYSALSEPGINSSLKARELARKMNHSAFEGSSENFLGLFYLNKQKFDEANLHFKRALQLIDEYDTTKWISKKFHILGNLGESYLKKGQADSAIYYANASRNICYKTNNTRGIALANWNIAEAYILKNKIDSATKYIQEGLNLCRDSYSMADVRLFLLSAAIKLNNDQSEQFLNDAFELFGSPFPSNFSKIEFLEKALEYYARNKRYADAYRIQELLNTQKENIQVSEDSLRLNLLENYYINENKLRAEKENRIRTELEIKSGRLIILALISVLSALLTLVLAYRFRQKQKMKIRELAYQKEKEELRIAKEAGEYKSRLDAIEEERNRIARELHDDIGSAMSSLNIFSGLAIEKFDSKPSEAQELLKKVKEQSISISDSLSDLIWAVYTKNDTYGHLIQRMKNFCFEILSAQGINPDFRYPHELQHRQAGLEVRKNLLLIFKEAVNNIAKHSKASNAEIVFTSIGNEICLSIKDDGIGFDSSNSTNGNGTSSMVSRSRSIGGKLTITSSAGSGSTIMVCFTERN